MDVCLQRHTFFIQVFCICIQVYSEVLSKVTPHKREREWQGNINWNEKIYISPPHKT
jgi:hypothetical protein